MERDQAIAILRQLAAGTHPSNGEVLGQSDACQDANAVRALYVAVSALELQRRRARVAKPPNQGKPWDEAEDRQLLAAFDAGHSMQELADRHQRTVAGIRARLLKYGRLAA
jgi:hypothetical protein